MASLSIVVHKAERVLALYNGGVLAASMPVALGFAPEGHKSREGDGKTPEGSYFICLRNERSRYHLSMGLNYPNERDAEAGLAAGLIRETQHAAIAQAQAHGERPPWDTALGGEIMIHGGGRMGDWTAGCIALDNGDMDVLWRCVGIGTPVEIRP